MALTITENPIKHFYARTIRYSQLHTFLPMNHMFVPQYPIIVVLHGVSCGDSIQNYILGSYFFFNEIHTKTTEKLVPYRPIIYNPTSATNYNKALQILGCHTFLRYIHCMMSNNKHLKPFQMSWSWHIVKNVMFRMLLTAYSKYNNTQSDFIIRQCLLLTARWKISTQCKFTFIRIWYICYGRIIRYSQTYFLR